LRHTRNLCEPKTSLQIGTIGFSSHAKKTAIPNPVKSAFRKMTFWPNSHLAKIPFLRTWPCNPTERTLSRVCRNRTLSGLPCVGREHIERLQRNYNCLALGVIRNRSSRFCSEYIVYDGSAPLLARQGHHARPDQDFHGNGCRLHVLCGHLPLYLDLKRMQSPRAITAHRQTVPSLDKSSPR
jgi:hypothetical protein